MGRHRENIVRNKTEVNTGSKTTFPVGSAAWLISSNINALLAATGTNPNQLAKHLNTHPSTVYTWTDFEGSPKLGKLDEIAIFFRVSIADLFRSPDEKIDPMGLRGLFEGVDEMEAAYRKIKDARNALAHGIGIPRKRETTGNEKLDRSRPTGVGSEGWDEEDGD